MIFKFKGKKIFKPMLIIDIRINLLKNLLKLIVLETLLDIFIFEIFFTLIN